MSEIIMKPVAMFRDPFRRGKNLLVLCDTYRWTDSSWKELVPANSNFRHHAKAIFDKAKDRKFWFGIEQEYSLLVEQNNFTSHPLGFPTSGFPGPQGPYYCSVGANNCYGREVMDVHYRLCLYAGVNVSGTNAEVMPGQWEFQVGPCEGIDIGDHLWMARYILGRVSEDYGLIHSFAPKLFSDWNGAGCHCNFSDEKMRSGEGGMAYINEFCEKLEGKDNEVHKLHISVYGENKDRLTGLHETSRMDKFSYGVANRAASVRIPSQVANENGKGYIEDRRPASDIDPYVVASLIIDSTTNDVTMRDPLIQHYRKWQAGGGVNTKEVSNPAKEE